MPEDEAGLLREINRKLDQLVILAKISNRHALEELARDIERDKVAQSIAAKADGSLTYSAISKAVSAETGAHERTVKARISELVDKGVLIARRGGREVYYERSGLLAW